MSVNRWKVGDTNQCAPKSGEVICVKVRRSDRSTAHQHFAADEMRKARAWEKATAAESRAPVRHTKQTFAEYAERWFAAHPQADPATVWSTIRRAFPMVGDLRVSDIDGTTLAGLQTTLLAPTAKQVAEGRRTYARNSVETTMHYVKAIMRQAVTDGLVERDPTIGLRMPRRDSRDTAGVVTPEQVPTHAEALAIIDAAPTRYRLALLLGFGCGMRIGEVLGLTPAQVDLIAGTVRIDAQQQRRGRVGPKTWRGVRTIEAADQVLFELRRVLRDKPIPDVPLLVGPRGAAPRHDDFYRRAWRPSLRAAGLPEDAYKFHSTRHYCVSAMLARGVPVTEVAAYVGDAVETISGTYAHWLRDAPSMAKGALTAALAPPASTTPVSEAQGDPR